MSVIVAGCSSLAATRSGTTSSTLPGSLPTSVGALSATEGLGQAKLGLAKVSDADPATIHIGAGEPQAAGANVILEWSGGRAEVDGATGIVYSAAVALQQADPSAQFLVPERLRYEALTVIHALGWSDGTLAGLGFEEQDPGTLAAGTGQYMLTWNRYDAKGVQRSGSILLSLDGRTGKLVAFSVLLGSDTPNIAGAISEASALRITETEIFLRTDNPKIPLTGDGSLILLGRTLSEQVTVVRDSKIVKKPTLCWVITLRGSVGSNEVGATVYIDAMTGKVAKYEPYKPDKPATTTTSLEG